MRLLLLTALIFFSSPTAFALDIHKVSDDIFALVGEKKQRSPSNLGNNATFGLIKTQDGLVLVDPGGSWKGAQMIHETIKTVSDQPVKYVINSGGQDHRWLGNGYWKAQGAKIIASIAAVEDQKERSSQQLSMLKHLLGPGLDKTEPDYADITFESVYSLNLGGLFIEIHHVGPAHTPGDSFIWIKDNQTLFSGDIIYVERLLGIGTQSNSKSWLQVFEEIAKLQPKHIIPGHGSPTTLKVAKKQTYDYLLNIRNKIREHLDQGGDMITAPKIDQSAFADLEQFDALAGRNAQQVFSEMEWED
ncbi:MAG: MBL fold metallo-hydrolase [Methylocystaceae bacterium]|nr:MBL fold metallo-hydrolase [Methylocystaceae bacterium]